MAARDFTINLKVDRSQAAAAARQQAADFGDVVGKAKQAGDAQEAAANRAGGALGRFTKGAGEAGTAAAAAGQAGAEGFGAAALAANLGTMALGKMAQAAAALGQALEAAAQKQEALAKGFASQGDKLRELAGMEGKQVDAAYTLDFAKFQKATAMRPEEALAFRTEFLNSGAQYLGRTISQGEAGQLQEQAASLAVARGLDPRQVGDLAGNLLGAKDWQQQFGDQASEAVLGTVARVMAGLGRGRGETSQLLGQTTELMAASVNEDVLKGTFRTPEEAAALVSTMAEYKPAEAGVYAQAAIRSLRDFQDKKMGPELQKAGVTPLMPFAEAAERFGKVITEESTAEGVPIQDIIARYAPDIRQQRALATLINKGLGPQGAMADRMKFMGGFGAETATADIGAFRATDVGMTREAEADVALAQAQRGAELQRPNILRTQAIAELTREKQIDTTAAEISNFVARGASFGLIAGPERAKIDLRVAEILRRRGAGVGVTPAAQEPGIFGGLGGGLLAPFLGEGPRQDFTVEGRNANFDQTAAAITAGGGNPMADAADKLGRAADRLVPAVPAAIPAGVGAGAIRD